MSTVTARLEGGPYDGYAKPLPAELRPVPLRLAARECSSPWACVDPDFHLHILDVSLFRNPVDGYTIYHLAQLDNDGVLYRYGDDVVPADTQQAEAIA